MSKAVETTARKHTGTILVLWAFLVLYGLARILQMFSGKVPIVAVVALHVLPPFVFALIHGTMFYRARGILTFFAICLVVGNIFENVGVRTGFPFGDYYFTERMGPKLSVVPIQLGLAYLGMAYLSWTLARVILGGIRSPLTGTRVVTLPLIAAFIMVAWDFSQDPVWSTILHLWIWREGGAYFGVPVSNFSAGISRCMSSTNCSRFICAAAQLMSIPCLPHIGFRPCCSMERLRPETSSSSFRRLGPPWFPILPEHSGE